MIINNKLIGILSEYSNGDLRSFCKDLIDKESYDEEHEFWKIFKKIFPRGSSVEFLMFITGTLPLHLFRVSCDRLDDRTYLSDEEKALLERAEEQGYLQYRDPECQTFVDFLPSEGFDEKEEYEKKLKSYHARNEGGTIAIAEKLEEMGLLKFDTMAWHITYKPVEK